MADSIHATTDATSTDSITDDLDECGSTSSSPSSPSFDMEDEVHDNWQQHGGI